MGHLRNKEPTGTELLYWDQLAADWDQCRRSCCTGTNWLLTAASHPVTVRVCLQTVIMVMMMKMVVVCNNRR